MKDISSLVQYNVSLSSHCSLFCQVPNLVAGSAPCYSERDTRGKEGGGGGGCEGAETERPRMIFGRRNKIGSSPPPLQPPPLVRFSAAAAFTLPAVSIWLRAAAADMLPGKQASDPPNMRQAGLPSHPIPYNNRRTPDDLAPVSRSPISPSNLRQINCFLLAHRPGTAWCTETTF